jgi:hypothetical protein
MFFYSFKIKTVASDEQGREKCKNIFKQLHVSLGESISLPSTTCKSKQRAIDVLGLAYFGFTSHRIRAQEKWNPYNKNINFEIV